MNIQIFDPKTDGASLEFLKSMREKELTLFEKVLDHEIRTCLEDVFGIDNVFFNNLDSMNSIDVRCFVAMSDREYQGHVWFWSLGSTCGMIGIRSSISNILDGKKGTARFLLSSIKQFSIDNGFTKLVIPKPLSPMKHILGKL